MGRALICHASLGALVLVTAGCYDSRWGETKRAQQHAAAQLAPAQLRANESDEAHRVRLAKPLRVRIDASPDYQGETVDWALQVDETVERANDVLSRDLGVRIVVDAKTTWNPRVRTDDLAATLESLEVEDPNKGDEIVIGLVGGLARASDDFHNIGYARVLGHHLVMRAAGRAGEHDAIERSFDELPEEQRTRLRADLKSHRAASVLLHELGHVLGAIHEVSREGVMHPSYDRAETSYAPENVSLMRITLAHAGDPTHAPFYQERLSFLEAPHDGVWIEKERADAESALRNVLANTHVASSTSAAASASGTPATEPTHAPSATSAAPPPELADADRPVFSRAQAALAAGDVVLAESTASPLYKTYPKSYAVADLRCKIAGAAGLAWNAVRASCDPLMRLSGVPSH